VGCSNSGTPTGVAISITLTPPTATVQANGVVNIVASVANDSSGKGVSWSLSGVGKLSAETTTSVTYTAPATVTSTSIATVVATSIAAPSVNASLPITVSPPGAANVVPISVNGGPLAPTTIYPNGAFVTVQICAPSNGACQQIDNVLVDTGSFGLRLLGSEVTVPLVPLNDGSGNTLYDCINFLDGSFLWGAVAPANILLGGEVADSTSVQIIANPSFSIPSGCTGTNEDTQALLGANGILGVGPQPFDCGGACDPSAGGSPPPVYYLCSSGGTCNATFVSCGTLCGDTLPNQQVTNPVFNFAANSSGVFDNNGVIVELPAVNDVAATVNGNLIFGIGTESNNGLLSSNGTAATVLNLNSSDDDFSTNFGGEVLSASFIDSGTNGLLFPQINGSPTICSDNDTWYCPASTTPFTATNVGYTGTPENTVDFSVDNFDNVMAANPNDAAFSNLAGPLGTSSCSGGTGSCSFDWGLPFFYGRNVFTAINGVPPPSGIPAGPFFAY
jgi:hypothetical protein